MPTRVDALGTDEFLEFEEPIAPATVHRAVLLSPYGLTLRRVNQEETEFDPAGRYKETTVILENWRAEGLTHLFGFEPTFVIDPELADQEESDKATVLFQLSNDGGTTWYIWQDGPDKWVPAVGLLEDEFNSVEMVDRRIPLFPLCAPNQVRLKAKFIPGRGGLQRAVLCNTIIYYDCEKDLMEDVSRSLKRYLDSEFCMPMFYNAELGIPSQTVCIERDAGLDVQIKEPIKVFNTKSDPCKQINLFSGIEPDGRTIRMLEQQTGHVEVRFTGKPEVFIGAEDFFEISKIPSLVVFVDRMNAYTDIRVWAPEFQRSISRSVGKIELARIFYFIFITIRAQSSLRREALMMIDKVSELIDYGSTFDSVACGDHYCVMEQQQHVTEHRVEQGLYVTALSAKLMGHIYLRPGDDEANVLIEQGVTPLVREVNLRVGAEFSCNLNLPKHLRRRYRERTTLRP
jgi:hypothetical protein